MCKKKPIKSSMNPKLNCTKKYAGVIELPKFYLLKHTSEQIITQIKSAFKKFVS